MISVSAVDKTFEVGRREIRTLRSVSFEVAAGEFLAVIGASGSGKTTLIRSIAGLERPQAGVIRLRDRVVFDAAGGVDVSPQERRLGMVFQSYAIWPHLSVLDNVMLPLLRGQNRMTADAARRVAEQTLDLVGMAAFASRPAPLLSGGQQQRVALARALAVSADVLLMDEPLSNLDAQLREEVRRELKSLAHQLQATILYVTHDLSEAMALADRILILEGGVVVQIGTPTEIYGRPATHTLASFLGRINWVTGTPRVDGALDTPLGVLQTAARPTGTARVDVGIRSEHITLRSAATEPGEGTANRFPVTVRALQFLGSYALIDVDAGEERLVVESRAGVLPAVGDVLVAEVRPDALLVFEPSPA